MKMVDKSESPQFPVILPPGHPLRKKLQDGLVALSLGNLCFITSWFSQLYDADFGYFNRMPVLVPSLLALATNIIWVAALAWLVMRGLHRFHNPLFQLVSHLVFFSLLLIPLDFCRLKVFGITDYQVYHFVKLPWVFLSLAALLVVIVWQHRWTARIAAVLVGILSPLAFFTLVKIALLCLGVAQLAQAAYAPLSRLPAAVPQGQPRVLWIIFDETDQRLGFEQRPSWLQMPEFDRLLGESVYATNAYSPDDGTLFSMPALISGQRVLHVSIKNSSDLTLTLADTGKVVSWSELSSVFSSARELGVNTAVVGWYHPYDRVLAGALNYCVWYPYPGFESSRGPTFGTALRREIGNLAGSVYRRRIFLNICRDSQAKSLSVVTNATYGLTLLHLPPPHKPGIYLAAQDRFTILGMSKTTGYFNNLMLADRDLGQLRRAMETSGQWNKTWLIVSTDHSWRESRVYDGKRDLRVPFLIKAPGKGKSITYSPQLSTVLTHDLILAILRGEVRDQESAVTWLDAHRRPEPTIMHNGQLD
jgi:hypothetical protein